MKAFRALSVLLVLAACFSSSANAALLQQISPVPTSYLEGTDFRVMAYSGIGDVTAPLWSVDLSLGLGNGSTSGCEAADFAGFVVGSIALLQRGVCTFEMKAENAIAAGAVGALIFNQGNTADRTDVFSGTLGLGFSGGIPVVGLSYDLGFSLNSSFPTTVRLVVTEQDVAAAIPEPATIALLSIGLAGLGFGRRKAVGFLCTSAFVAD